MITTSKLVPNDIVRFGNIVTGFKFATVIKKEKAFKARQYFVTLQYSHGGQATEVFASNQQWVKVNA